MGVFDEAPRVGRQVAVAAQGGPDERPSDEVGASRLRVGDALVARTLLGATEREVRGDLGGPEGVGIGDPQVDRGRVSRQLGDALYRFSSARTSASEVAMVSAA